jgi:23S rRNA (cytidine1920-2'-O)/16S rRNA (cytidine1409-2'-O)-methyltransferase
MKQRPVKLLDLLTKRFPDYERDELYSFIMCSEILVDGAVIRDPAAPVHSDVRVELSRQRYVSRAGDKLAAALSSWEIDTSGKVWLDAGASTGGFTDALLQAGARHVHAVDVGYNQLDYRLRVDPRVTVRERCNILAISSVEELEPPPNAAVCDLSFRSLRGVLSHILDLTTEGWGIALLKPQFEVAAEVRWGRREEGGLTAGIVDPELRMQVVSGVVRELGDEGVVVSATMDSPVAGRNGNREVLLHVRRSD